MVQDKSIDSVSKRPSYKNLSAVKNNKVFNDINPDIILRPGPRVAQGLDEIFKRIYQ